MSGLIWILCALFVTSCGGFRILVIFPVPGKSHSILGDRLVQHLTNAGHEITYITPFPKKDRHPLIEDIDVSSNLEILPLNAVKLKLILDKTMPIDDYRFIFALMGRIGAATLANERVQNMMKDRSKKIDVIIAEYMFTDLYSVLPTVFDCPLIWISTVEPSWLILQLVDQAPNPAYTADIFSNNVVPLNFVQRIETLKQQIRGRLVQMFEATVNENDAYQKNVVPILQKRGKPIPTYEELRHNASLVLGNSHVSMGEPMTLPQLYKPIGGYHIELPVKPLPEDLQKIMDNARHGVIYFSMGSNLKSKDLPQAIKASLLKMFGKLKQTVIWKFEEKMENTPANVHILHWSPQPSILAHPNCKLFITHGGLLSTTESIHFGVPIIGMPVFADQYNNVDRAVKRGFAKRVDITSDLADKLEVAIDEVLKDNKYTEKVKLLSLVYHDRLVPPGAELVHWVEHVVKTRGALHLRSPALMLPWYQKMYLDLLALVIIIIVTLIIVVKKLYLKLRNKARKKND